MCILKSVSKKDSNWRQIAFNITKDKNDADDLVQDMYLRLKKYNVERWNYTYIALTMLNIFKENKRKEQKYIRDKKATVSGIKKKHIYKFNYDETMYIEKLFKITPELKEEGLNDYELMLINRSERVLTDEEIQLLSLNYEYSTSQLAEILDKNRTTIHRDLESARVKVLKSDYSKKYKNRRLKYKK